MEWINNNIIMYRTDDGQTSVALYERDGNVWMNQAQLAELFDTSKQNISLHIQNIIEDWEVLENSVVKDYLTTASDGKDYTVIFYSLEMIIAIWFRVRSKRWIQFRKWANNNLQHYMVKGFLMDDERLKNPNGRPDYFDELLARIRDIRASEKRFYQKVRDLFSLSDDYDKTDKATQMFFAETQNKLLYAVTWKTAAEIIVDRADATSPTMWLTSWKWSVVRKQDITTAKNYLTEDEIDSLNRFVVVFLETAELRAKNKELLTMNFWRENVDKIIELNDKLVLDNPGSISNKAMESHVRSVYDEFDTNRKQQQALQADQEDEQELVMLEEMEKRVKEKK